MSRLPSVSRCAWSALTIRMSHCLALSGSTVSSPPAVPGPRPLTVPVDDAVGGWKACRARVGPAATMPSSPRATSSKESSAASAMTTPICGHSMVTVPPAARVAATAFSVPVPPWTTTNEVGAPSGVAAGEAAARPAVAQAAVNDRAVGLWLANVVTGVPPE